MLRASRACRWPPFPRYFIAHPGQMAFLARLGGSSRRHYPHKASMRPTQTRLSALIAIIRRKWGCEGEGWKSREGKRRSKSVFF